MERVQTLSDKLHEQLAGNAPVDQLLLTVQLLQSELMHLHAASGSNAASIAVKVAPFNIISQPVQQAEPASSTIPEIAAPPKEEEKTVEVLQVNEAEIEAELEEIKRNAEERNKISAQNKPSHLFDPVEDIPTLTHQQTYEPPVIPFVPVNTAKKVKELHESIADMPGTSLNDKLKQGQAALSDALQDMPIKDLKKGIGLNDRFHFIKELFRGDETMYERSIKTINGFSIFPEAEYWIKRELKLKLGWDDRNETVRQFDQLVRRRFA